MKSGTKKSQVCENRDHRFNNQWKSSKHVQQGLKELRKVIQVEVEKAKLFVTLMLRLKTVKTFKKV